MVLGMWPGLAPAGDDERYPYPENRGEAAASGTGR
jgi:hypothetical protein